MSCNELGFDDYGNLTVTKSADLEAAVVAPSSYDFTGYTGELQVRATEAGASALLTITETATAAGSLIDFEGAAIGLLIKAADLATLPDDATDADEPWVGTYQWVITSPTGFVTELSAGSIIAKKGVVR